MATTFDARSSGSVNLLISMLVRYPEVTSLNYDPATNRMRFTFLSPKELPAEQVAGLAQRVRESVDAYTRLENIEWRHVQLTHEVLEGITVLEFERDVESLTLGEISLVIALLGDELEGGLLAEGPESPVEEEEQTHQEEIIESLLDDLRATSDAQRLIAFREEGRVLVFNN
ncbi:MAG: hypothetical protein IRY92_04630, partial [Dactylosporangium sp.]|nr:hypothetical protein [Dactylosporangium sp.]